VNFAAVDGSGMIRYTRVSQGNIRGWLREDIFYALPTQFINDPFSSTREMGGQVIKESRWRWAAIFPLPSGQKVFLKRDRTKDWIESLKYLFLPSRARKEWFVAYQLQKKNLQIPKPLGWMERIQGGFVKESYYLSEAIGSGSSLMNETVQLSQGALIAEMAKTVKKIHDSGLFHKDFHAGNFILDEESFFLTDLHGAKIIRSLSLSQRLWNLSHLFHSLRSTWGEEEQMRFLDKYFKDEIPHFREKMLQKIHFFMDCLQRRKWRSRTKRCLKESSEFSIQREKGVSYYHRKDYPLVAAKRCIEEHLVIGREKPSSLIKRSPDVAVSILDNKERRICVKQFRYKGLWNHLKNLFRRSKGLEAWVGGNGLRARGIDSIGALALVERRNWLGAQESFLMMEVAENGGELDRYLLKGFDDVEQKRMFIRAFSQWLGHLHQMDIYHQDMKTCNVLVLENENTWGFRFLDLEDIRMDERVNEKKVYRNFLQLNTSTPKIITRTDRFRFFREYARLNPIFRNGKAFLKGLIEKSKEKGIVYVSPEGVVEEKF
jgi:tRNA A-37 threonylcarbamoyl transferase component Bud32